MTNLGSNVKKKKHIVLSLLLLSLITAGIAFSNSHYFRKPSLDVFSSAFASNDERYQLSSLRIFNRVILHIKDKYLDPDRIRAEEMFLKALDAVEKSVTEIVVVTPEDLQKQGKKIEDPNTVEVSVRNKKKSFSFHQIDSLWKLAFRLKDVFTFIEENNITSVPLNEIEYAAVNGMLSTLDPHSVLLLPEMFDEMKLSTRGEFGGLGIVIGIRDGFLTVISPLEGTPAYNAGLKSRDRILRIGEESTINMPLDQAVKRLRGPKGTLIDIWVSRKGWSEPKKFELERDDIKVISISHENLGDNIGYVKLKSFQKNSHLDIRQAITDIQSKMESKMKGVILDLRNNPGGLLEQAVAVANLFLDHGDIVTNVGFGNKLREVKTATAHGSDVETPIVILVNSGSASASEIVAGALKNHNRAVIIGQQTFGKGSVQVLFDDFPDNSALKLTIAQYLTPGDKSIQSVGITPDIELEPLNITKEHIELFHAGDTTREADLKQHLDQTSAAQATVIEKPIYTIKYLQPKDNDDEEKDADEEYSYMKFRSDTEIEFAKKLLLSVPFNNRDEMLKKSSELIEKTQKSNSEIIEKELLKYAVRWQNPSAQELSKNIKVVFDIASENKTLQSGDNVRLKLTVTNEDKKLSTGRLHGLSESKFRYFDDVEFIVGILQPLESKTIEVPVKIPLSQDSAANEITMKMFAEEQPLSQLATKEFIVLSSARPHFGYRYVLHDNILPESHDGVLQSGEKIDMVVFVKNTGKGNSKDTLVRISNDTGPEIFIEQGSATLGALKPDETKTARFSLSIKESDKDSASIKLFIYDTDTSEFLTEKLQFSISKTKVSAKPMNAWIKMQSKCSFYQDIRSHEPLFSLDPNNVIQTTARSGNRFYALAVDGFPLGWIENCNSVKSAKPQTPTQPSLHLFSWYESPSIIIENDSPQFLNTRNIQVKGLVQSKQNADLVVFINNQKIYYTHIEDKKDSYPFELSLPLEEGENIVSFATIQNGEFSAKKQLGLFYRLSSISHVP